MPVELTIVTPEGEAFSGAVESVVLPGTEGEFGVLEGHEVFMTALQPGPLSVLQEGETLLAAVSRGFAEVHGNRVTVMVGSCEYARDIDLDRAQVARDRALAQLERMRGTEDGEAAYQEYQEEYSRALARVAVSKRFKG